MYREVSPTKIREQRGKRPRREIVEGVTPHLSAQDLFLYEKGKIKPTTDKLKYLLAGLGCSYEDISEPVDLRVTV